MAGDNQKRLKNNPAHSLSDKDTIELDGDPGVGGLLADPLEAASKSDNENVAVGGLPSPDPKPPAAHGDWAPNRAWHDSKKS